MMVQISGTQHFLMMAKSTVTLSTQFGLCQERVVCGGQNQKFNLNLDFPKGKGQTFTGELTCTSHMSQIASFTFCTGFVIRSKT
jgi:hypothetical protein